jgi:hypothetical protein
MKISLFWDIIPEELVTSILRVEGKQEISMKQATSPENGGDMFL